MNTPGTVNDDNWSYRMAMEVAELANDAATTRRLRDLAARTGRLPAPG